MSIEFPETFGEAYWNPSVKASQLYDDDIEKALNPFLKGILAALPTLESMPEFLQSLVGAFGTPGHAGLAGTGSNIVGNTGAGFIQAGLQPLTTSFTYRVNEANPVIDIPESVATQLLWRKIIPLQDFYFRMVKRGYDEFHAQEIYRSEQPYPDINGLLSYLRFNRPGESLYESLREFADVDGREIAIWDWLNQVQLSGNEIQELYRRGKLLDVDATLRLGRIGYSSEAIPDYLDLAYTLPNPVALLQSAVFRDGLTDDLERAVAIGGIHPDYAPQFIEAVLTKPDVTTIVQYLLRIDPKLSNLEQELGRIGIHPDYHRMFRTLAYPVPPVADLITMAVREAFSPVIAARFGQYEDYPDDLTQFAQQQGISEEWSRRYWAAHWSLPSPQQGFEMLHRGVINEADLNLLLRALDIMPFWRDKLIQISYNPLTRVDVRRMYGLGVLNESELTEAYRAIGYTQQNAERLRDFTIKLTVASQSGLSVAKIVTAYKNAYTTRTEAFNAIGRLGVRGANISEILENADIQLGWKRVQDRIAAIKNLYKKERVTETQARQELTALRLDSDKINLLIQQWLDEVEQEKTVYLSKTDVLSLIKRNKVTRDRAIQELRLLGYTDERIGLLLSTVEE